MIHRNIGDLNIQRINEAISSVIPLINVQSNTDGTISQYMDEAINSVVLSINDHGSTESTDCDQSIKTD